MNQKTVNLNGKRYDAVTGQLLGNAPDGDTPKLAQAIDIVGPSNTFRRSGSVASSPAKAAAHRSTPHHMTPHAQQHAKTLMRKAVKKPVDSFKRHTKPVAHTSTLIKNPTVTVVPKHTVARVDARRVRHAQQVPPSTMIKHFNAMQPQPVRQTTAPSIVTTVPSAPRPAVPTHTTVIRPVPIRPQAPVQTAARPATTTAQPQRRTTEDIFEHALAQATSHTQPPHPLPREHKKRRLPFIAQVGIISLAAIAILGFFAYKNMGAIQLKLVSSRAGIHATLPSWQPGGFNLASLAATPGSVTMDFRDSHASAGFSVVQTATSWDSNSLLSDYVLPSTNASYDTIQAAGNTIYTYGNNDATWVTNGIWYRLVTNGTLNTDQIVHLVGSM